MNQSDEQLNRILEKVVIKILVNLEKHLHADLTHCEPRYHCSLCYRSLVWICQLDPYNH